MIREIANCDAQSYIKIIEDSSVDLVVLDPDYNDWSKLIREGFLDECIRKTNKIHFAWDRYEDKDIIQPKFLKFREISKVRNKDLQVYVLCNFNTTHEQDLYRVEWLKENGFAPYVMVYNKHDILDLI